jgi:hypothetical protein
MYGVTVSSMLIKIHTDASQSSNHCIWIVLHYCHNSILAYFLSSAIGSQTTTFYWSIGVTCVCSYKPTDSWKAWLVVKLDKLTQILLTSQRLLNCGEEDLYELLHSEAFWYARMIPMQQRFMKMMKPKITHFWIQNRSRCRRWRGNAPRVETLSDQKEKL